MARKREQRLRRKARAQLRELQRRLDEANAMRPVWLAALAYVAEIDAPNPHEPFSIANRRTELIDTVHACRGQRERTRRDHQVVRARQGERSVTVVSESEFSAPAPVVPLRPVAPRAPAPPPKETRMQSEQPSRERIAYDVEVKRNELRNAAKRYGAEANKRRRDMKRVAELGAALDAAAKAFTLAEARLNLGDRRAERAAMGSAS